MENIFLIVQMISALILIIFILIQSKGTGFGRAWGGSSSFTRRGLEKIVFRATFAVSAVFIIMSIIQLVI